LRVLLQELYLALQLQDVLVKLCQGRVGEDARRAFRIQRLQLLGLPLNLVQFPVAELLQDAQRQLA
jgi:hypothetical protein